LEFFGDESTALPQWHRENRDFLEEFLSASAVKELLDFSSFIFYELAERSSNSICG
jgi:hypothetical protein